LHHSVWGRRRSAGNQSLSRGRLRGARAAELFRRQGRIRETGAGCLTVRVWDRTQGRVAGRNLGPRSELLSLGGSRRFEGTEMDKIPRTAAGYTTLAKELSDSEATGRTG